jgi:rhomboid protease GluP
MNRKEQLRFCSKCKHQAFDPKRGIICSLTGEQADFTEQCEHFSGSIEEVEAEIANEIRQKEKNEDIVETGRHFNLLELVIPGKRFFFTPIILYTNILMFVAMVASGSNPGFLTIDDLIKWGGNYKLLTIDGQFWRLATALFVHAGIIHLFANMYAFLIVAILLEPLIGRFRFGLAYLTTGVAASITSLWLNPAIIGVGASGAILGMYGIYISLLTTSTVSKKTRLIILPSMLVYALYIIASGMMNAQVDNAAHWGGFIAGIVFGYALYFGIASPENKSKNLVRILIVLTGVILYGYIVSQSNSPYIRYQKLLSTFLKYNQKGLEAYNFKETDSYEEILYKLEVVGMKSWRDCINSTFQIEMIDELPEPIKKSTTYFREYANKQQMLCGYLAKKLRTHSNLFDSNIFACSNDVDSFLHKGFLSEFLNKKACSTAARQAYNKLEFIQRNILLVVNGTPMPGKYFSDLEPWTIESVLFLENDAAEKLYGPKAKWGAYMVKTSK